MSWKWVGAASPGQRLVSSGIGQARDVHASLHLLSDIDADEKLSRSNLTVANVGAVDQQQPELAHLDSGSSKDMCLEREIVEVNEALRADPSLANSDPMGAGWFFKVRVTEMAQFDALMDEPAYAEFAKNA